MKVIIVGGVAGGASAAARLRRLDEKAEIVLYERGEFISFANCGLPYHISGTIPERDSLLVQTAEGMSARFNVAVKPLHEVLSINKDKKTVKVKNLKHGEIKEESYDYLILSPGATPLVPPIPGIDSKKIFTLRNIPDMDNIISSLETGIKDVVVVGGGFIGVEMAENLKERGMNVSLIEMQDQVLTFLDPDLAAHAHHELRSGGIELYLSNGVKEFEDKNEKIDLILSDGNKLAADIVILAIGVRAETHLATEAGLELGETKSIKVNEKMMTSDPSIYAVGDAIEITNFVTNKPGMIPLAGPANRQARIAANNICGIESTYKNTQGTGIVKVFDMACASTGVNSHTLKKEGIPFRTLTIHGGSHAGYYPEAYIIHLKLLYSPEGKILGAQACGYDGVDKRMDVLAAAIRHGANVTDLIDYELSYAPPFGSAKDPVNMAGFVANNDLTGFAPLVNIENLDEHLKAGAILIDVRTPEEVECGKIENARHIELETLRKKLVDLPKNNEIIVYCKVGVRGYIAQRILKQNGFEKVYNLSGGYDTYSVFKTPELLSKPCANTKIADDHQVHSKSRVPVKDLKTSLKIDACGMQCPGPLLQLKKGVDELETGEILEITASDSGFYKDVQAFAESSGMEILELTGGKKISAKIRVNKNKKIIPAGGGDQTTIVVHSGDFDKVMAALIIGNGALAMGKKVSLFFTFWGLNALRKNQSVHVKKTFIEKMFGFMMPRGSKKLMLSKMHMMGMGTWMIKDIMKKFNVENPESLLQSLIDGGGKLIACKMTMDLMGIKPEEIIDGVDEGGVATFLADAEKGNITLFI